VTVHVPGNRFSGKRKEGGAGEGVLKNEKKNPPLTARWKKRGRLNAKPSRRRTGGPKGGKEPSAKNREKKKEASIQLKDPCHSKEGSVK